jgi:hypothetical protein
MAEWSEDHVAAIGSLNLNFGIFGRIWLNWRPPPFALLSPVSEKWRPSVGKVGEWYVESQHLQGCSPSLCQLRTDGLAPRVSIERTYRMLVYGFSRPSSLPSIDDGFTPTASMVASGRETRYGPADRSAIVLWIMSGALFSRA